MRSSYGLSGAGHTRGFLSSRPTCAVVVVALALCGSACTKYQDMARIRAGISAGIAQQSGLQVLLVSCPESRKAEPGDHFECAVTLENGSVTVDVAQDEYANATWKQREAFLDMRMTEKAIVGVLKSRGRNDVTVSCPGNKRPSTAESVFECSIMSATAGSIAIKVTVRDIAGRVDWSVPASFLQDARGRAHE